MSYQTPKTDFNSESYLNIADIQKIEDNEVALADLIETFGTRPSVSTKTWTTSDYPTEVELNRIETNLDNIKTAIGAPSGWQSSVTWSALQTPTYLDFNRLGNNTVRLYTAIMNIKEAFLQCGSLICGGGNTRL